jgi:uncharacterized RDD family membrane protein YckC
MSLNMENMPQEDGSIFHEHEIIYARFGPRFGATLIDGILLMLIAVPLTYFNVTRWKMPALFALTSIISIIYKPYMEYKFSATLGKMAVGIQVLGYGYKKITLNEELRRVSFYLIPNIVSQIITISFYFSDKFRMIKDFKDYNDYITSANPALFWLNGIVIALFVADCFTFFTNPQKRALHDVYAGTYVVERINTNGH